MSNKINYQFDRKDSQQENGHFSFERIETRESLESQDVHRSRDVSFS